MESPPVRRPLPPDNHAHTQFSADRRPESSMRRSCEYAVARGIPAVAFTDHLDFTLCQEGDAVAGLGLGVAEGDAPPTLDVEAYLAEVEACRALYPALRILTGVESGEPHLFDRSLAAVLGRGTFERVLGSCHSVPYRGRLVGVDSLFRTLGAHDVVRRYFSEVLALVGGSPAFEVLAHVDFARRYVPPGFTCRERDFEEEYRAVFRALAGSGRVLEVNTKSPLASVDLVRWWGEEGGRAVSFGGDAHVPWLVGEKFEMAVDIVEAAGFRPGRDAHDFWRR